MDEPLAAGAVADLIVRLGVRDQARARPRSEWLAVRAAPEARVSAVEEVAVMQHVDERLWRGKVLEVPVLLAREQDVKCVVEIVVPVRVETVTALVARADDDRIVVVVFADHLERAAEPGSEVSHRIDELGDEVELAGVDDRVD